MVDFETFLDNHHDNVMVELEDIIDTMNIPKKVSNKMIDIIYEYEYEIMEDRYSDMESEAIDRAYDEYKDSRYDD